VPAHQPIALGTRVSVPLGSEVRVTGVTTSVRTRYGNLIGYHVTTDAGHRMFICTRHVRVLPT